MFSRRSITTTTFEPECTIQPIYTGGDVALDHSGRVLATCLGEDALLTELHTGKILARIDGDGEVLTSLIITPTASHIVLCSRSLLMRIYSLHISENSPPNLDPVLTSNLKPHSTPVISSAVDQTGTLIATGSADGIIKVWDIRGGYLTHTFRGHGGIISALRFFETSSPPMEKSIPKSKKKKKRRKDNETPSDEIQDVSEPFASMAASFFLASGGEDGKVRIWSLHQRMSVASLESHVSVVRQIDFSAEDDLLLTGSRDKTVTLWEARTWKVRKVIPILERVEAVGFLNNGALVYSGGENGQLRIWDLQGAREITKELEARSDTGGIECIIAKENLGFLLCVHADQSLILHSTAAIPTLSPSNGAIDSLPVLRRISGTHDEIIDLAYVSPGRSLLALATNSEAIRLVSLATTDSQSSSLQDSSYLGADVALLKGHEDIVICLDVDWSGHWLVTGAKDNTARLWKIDHVKKSYLGAGTFTGHAESLGAIALPSSTPPVGSAANKDPLNHPPTFFLTGSQDRTIKRWDVAKASSGKEANAARKALYTRKAHDKDINALSVNHNSTLFASASQDRTVKIWSVEDGEMQGVLRGHRRGVWSVRFAPNGFPTITGDTGPASASRGLVLTGGGDKSVKIWSLTDYSCLRTLEGHTNSVLKVLWMPPIEPSDAANTSKRTPQIATAGGDGLVKVWDANSGECACTLDNHADRVWALTVNPETNMLVSGGGDSVVTFWKDTTSSTMAATAAASTQQVEQEQQLQNYVHRGSYREAITLALQLNHPARLLALLKDVTDTNPPEAGSLSGLKAVDEVLGNLGEDQLLTLMQRLRDWNTNARSAVVAQRILGVVTRMYPATRLAGLRRRGWKEVLEALKVYTERHYRRVEELVDESYLVEYTLREMEELMGGDIGTGAPVTNGESDITMV